MDIQEQISICNRDAKLTNEQKKMRLGILKTMIIIQTKQGEIEQLKDCFLTKAVTLSQRDESFLFQPDVVANKEFLENYLLGTQASKNLGLTEITEDNLYDIKYQVFKYAYQDQVEIETVIELLRMIQRIFQNLEISAHIIKDRFQDMLGKEIVAKYNGIMTENNSILEELKSSDEYKSNCQKALDSLNQYFDNQMLDLVTYEYSVRMIYQLFDYYQSLVSNNHSKIKKAKIGIN